MRRIRSLWERICNLVFLEKLPLNLSNFGLSLVFIFLDFFETGSDYVAQAGFALMILLPQVLSVYHYTQLNFRVFFNP
jgi:hypothetical protein